MLMCKNPSVWTHCLEETEEEENDRLKKQKSKRTGEVQEKQPGWENKKVAKKLQ